MRVSDVRSTSRICRSCFTARKAQTPGSSCGRSSNAEISAAELNGGADTENCRPMMVGRTHRKCQRVSEGSCAKFAHRCLVLSCFRSFFLLLVSTLKRSVVARNRGTDIKSTTTRRWTPGLVRKLDKETRFIAARSGLLATALPPLLKGMSDAPPALRVRRSRSGTCRLEAIAGCTKCQRRSVRAEIGWRPDSPGMHWDESARDRVSGYLDRS